MDEDQSPTSLLWHGSSSQIFWTEWPMKCKWSFPANMLIRIRRTLVAWSCSFAGTVLCSATAWFWKLWSLYTETYQTKGLAQFRNCSTFALFMDQWDFVRCQIYPQNSHHDSHAAISSVHLQNKFSSPWGTSRYNCISPVCALFMNMRAWLGFVQCNDDRAHALLAISWQPHLDY